jgi:hypothetical protein
MCRLFMSFAAILCLAFTAAEAQQSSIIGTWSTAFNTGDGQPFAALLVSFDANGRCQERITVRQGMVTNWCQYRLSPDATTLQTLFYDYAPKTITPSRPLNQWTTARLQWQGRDLFFVMEATGPLRYVRQR